MNKMTALILVVIIGFVICGLSLRRIEHYLHQCLLKLTDLDANADRIETYAGQISASVDKD
jgi:hypothetical protein